MNSLWRNLLIECFRINLYLHLDDRLVMKYFSFIFILTLAACSTPDLKNQPLIREPSSANQCSELVGYFINSHNSPADSITKEELLSRNLIAESDLALLRSPMLANELMSDPKNKTRMEVSFLLIKKQYKHFEADQVLSHYHLLESYCGI